MASEGEDGGRLVSGSAAVRRLGHRWRRLDQPARVALLFGMAGVGYRLVLMLLTVPGSNSDEATFGLAALHIAAGREWPIFLYGQHYMGMLESYLAAPLLAVTGPSWPMLRAPLLLLYAAFLFLMYRLTRQLYTPWLATFTIGLLALGSERVIRDQMTTVGGRPEVKPAVVLLLMIAVALGEGRVRHRWSTYTLFGLVAGAALWSDWLVLPYLAVAGVVLLVAAGRDLLGIPVPLLAIGFTAGVFPMLLHNLTAAPGADSWSVFQQISTGVSAPAGLAQRLQSGLGVGLPLAAGICPPGGCTSWQQAFGPFYLGLLLAGGVLALVTLRRAIPQHAARVRPIAQLALVTGAALTLLGYVRSPLSATAPLETARYLSMLQISLPAVLWPAWLAAGRLHSGMVKPRRLAVNPAGPGQRLAGVAGVAALTAITTFGAYTTGVLVIDSDDIRAEERRARDLAATIQRIGLRHVYSDYWTCNRLIFHSGEQVFCAVLREDLRPGQNRYRPYRTRVDRATNPGYVFTASSPAEAAFRRYLTQRSVHADIIEVGDYRVYRPATTVRPWR